MTRRQLLALDATGLLIGGVSVGLLAVAGWKWAAPWFANRHRRQP